MHKPVRKPVPPEEDLLCPGGWFPEFVVTDHDWRLLVSYPAVWIAARVILHYLTRVDLQGLFPWLPLACDCIARPGFVKRVPGYRLRLANQIMCRAPFEPRVRTCASSTSNPTLRSRCKKSLSGPADQTASTPRGRNAAYASLNPFMP